jgi:hypothetical protein
VRLEPCFDVPDCNKLAPQSAAQHPHRRRRRLALAQTSTTCVHDLSTGSWHRRRRRCRLTLLTHPRLVHDLSTGAWRRSAHVLRDALDVLSKAAGEPATEGGGGARRGLPLLFMRTVILVVQGHPELKQYVAVTLLPR